MAAGWRGLAADGHDGEQVVGQVIAATGEQDCRTTGMDGGDRWNGLRDRQIRQHRSFPSNR